MTNNGMSFKTWLYLVQTDLFRYTRSKSPKAFLKALLVYNGFIMTLSYRWMRYLYLNQWSLFLAVCKPINRFLQYFLSAEVDYHTEIGPGFYFVHVVGTMINAESKIGKNVHICHNVTIGNTPRGALAGTPVIGDNVFIAPGAVILGNIKIGNYAAIGANAVVTKDVPEHAVVAGIPAVVISNKGSDGYIVNTDYDAA